MNYEQRLARIRMTKRPYEGRPSLDMTVKLHTTVTDAEVLSTCLQNARNY